MNWLLIVTPIVGVVAVVCGILSLRYFLPLKHVNESGSDDAVRKTAVTIARVVGAAIRDERRASSKEVDKVLADIRR